MEDSVPDVKAEPQDQKVKIEEIAPQSRRVYTTTHYVGLELAEGRLSVRLDSRLLISLVGLFDSE
jgi:poly(A) polymerase